jgi:hypothetical protein
MSDYRDLAIEALALSEAELLDQIVELTIERNTYRQITQQAFHALREKTLETDRLRARIDALIEDQRHLKADSQAEVAA